MQRLVSTLAIWRKKLCWLISFDSKFVKRGIVKDYWWTALTKVKERTQGSNATHTHAGSDFQETFLLKKLLIQVRKPRIQKSPIGSHHSYTSATE